MEKLPATPFYAIASGMIGFDRSSLRVLVTRIDGQHVWIRTADLSDAGTPLVLDVHQIQPMDEYVTGGAQYSYGLVAFA
jgi:hypothetical protein